MLKKPPKISGESDMSDKENLNGLLSEMRRVDDKIMEFIGERLRISAKIGELNNECPDSMFSTAERFRSMGDMVGMNGKAAEELCRILTEESAIVRTLSHEDESPKLKVAVVGGQGQMGRAMGRLLKDSGHEITVIDPRAKNNLSLADTADSDVVVIATPISAVSDILSELDGICREDALIFDISSLKSPFVNKLKDLAEHRKVCSVHPMFGPAVRSMHGRNLVICDCGSEDAVNAAKTFLDGRGADIRIIPVDEHDRYMSYVLGLSHIVNIAFFTVLEKSGIPFKELRSLSSTTFDKMTDTIMSVALEEPELYHEIQNLNRDRDAMLSELKDAIASVSEAAASEDSENFTELMLRGREYLEG